MRIPFLATLFLLATLCGVPHVAHAAQSYDNCAHFIESVPTVLDKQGVWCMNKDMGTAQTSGSAITIGANNVTLDCNDFTLDGSGAAPNGIYAQGRQNITIRHCNVRGFRAGIRLDIRSYSDETGEHEVGGGGHLVEDNRLDNNSIYGIYVKGDHNLVRRNRVFDSGGSDIGVDPAGIRADADIISNIVDGVSGMEGQITYGIYASNAGTRIAGNRIGRLSPGTGAAVGINALAGSQTVVSNGVANTGVIAGEGIQGGSQYDPAFCAGNTVAGFATPYQNCVFVAGTSNLSH